MLIAFEGGEGSGKSTQIDALAATLREVGHAVRVSYEPGATPVGQRIRNLVLHTDEIIAPRAEAMLFAADRAHHVHTVVRPALAAGEVVLLDRFIDSSLAYQGAGRELAVDDIRRLSLWATGGLRPDLTVLLDLAASEGLARARGRSDFDRLERESIEFHERVRTGFLACAAEEPRSVRRARRHPSHRRTGRRDRKDGYRTAGGARAVSDVWSSLIGQPETVSLLQASAAAAAQLASGQSIATGSMSHAWLFTGPAGSGRSVAARALAAALQCVGDGPPGCGVCSACRTVLAGTHPDVRMVVPEGLSISVADIRSVVATAARLPAMGRWQVVVIEDADRMTEGASNALLKVIEEPPARTIFLLCAPSTHPDDVSVTIRSRCRLVSLRTPSVEAVQGVLTGDGVDPATAAWAAAISQGHVGRARRLARDPDARERRRAVLAIPASLQSLGACVRAADQLVRSAEAEASSITNELDADETQALQTALGAGSTGRGTATAVRGSVGVIKDLEKRQRSRATRTQRDALDRALVDLAGFYRDVLFVQAGAQGPFAHPDFDDEVRAVALAFRQSPAGALRCLDAILACRLALEQNVKPIIAVQALTATLRLPAA